ncbi:MAG: AAA family ATPase [Paludibacteraceae bacterium]|nr:AAA family ATPase [Paludibacteraceae bacterium]
MADTVLLENAIIEELPYTPNNEQKDAITNLAEFLCCREQNVLFLLRGHAGTGKTSLVGALIRVLKKAQMKTVLIAPTGRAAKVMASYSGENAYTIHKKIYRQNAFGNEKFSLSDNKATDTLFIVDESSMITNKGESIFGSGNLLDDLITFVYNGAGCRLIVIGDDAQLPPVGEEKSPAMSKDWLEGYGLEVKESYLSTVARQDGDSGILHNATLIRKKIENGSRISLPELQIDGFDDVKSINGAAFTEALEDEYAKYGSEETIVITRSNKQALIYNQGIRRQVLQRDDEIGGGDIVMIIKNNYFWGKEYKNLEFLANGDMAEVIRVRRHEELYGLRFSEATLRMIDYDQEIDAKILLDSIYADTPQATKELNDKLFKGVEEDYSDIPNKRDRMKKIAEDEHYNALQIKFGYAITCHKAQGGQWDSVFIDQGSLSYEQSEDYYNWLYTSITRAKKKLHFVNFPKECVGKITNF